MAQVQILYVATDDGVSQLASPGTTGRWRTVDAALGGQKVQAVRASATDPLQVFAGAAFGLYGTANGGATWDREHPAVVTALQASEDGSVYAGTNGGAILRRESAGWIEVHRGRAPVVYLNILADGRLAALYANGEIEFLLNSEWSLSDILVPHAFEVVSSVAHPEKLYISDGTGLITRSGARAVEGGSTGALAVLTGKPEVLLVGTKGLVQRTDDDCATIVPVDGPWDVRVLISPPHFQDHVYAGTGAGGLWASRDRGRSWNLLKEGLAPINDLSFARVQ